jgi:hypothetical protein
MSLDKTMLDKYVDVVPIFYLHLKASFTVKSSWRKTPSNKVGSQHSSDEDSVSALSSDVYLPKGSPI